jgi:upstream activation factor subunit UAF30
MAVRRQRQRCAPLPGGGCGLPALGRRATIAPFHDRFRRKPIDDGRLQGQHRRGPGTPWGSRHHGAHHSEDSMPSNTRGAKDTSSGRGARKVNPALQKPLQPSKELAAIVGSDPLPRPQMVSRVWDYIKKHDLQNPKNRREILADAKLKPIFGKDKVTMFEMNKYLSQHLK